MFSAGSSKDKDGNASPSAAAGPTGGGDAASTSSSSSNAPTQAQAVRFRVARQRQPNLGVGDATHRGHHYSKEEQAKLASFQSISYLPIHSKIYLEWLKTHFTTSTFANWFMMALVGIATGLAGASLKNIIQYFTKLKCMHVASLLAQDRFGLMWFYVTSVSLLLALGAAAVVVYLEPAAAGSGVPEVMAYLNGVSIPKVFNARTLLVKYTSVGLTVASGLYGGNEGPMIHIGASIGKICSQGTQLRNGWTIALFSRFRNMFDRRNFISAGCAAGVASAFGAPVGGLLFVLEEISSFWSHKLAWQIFFCTALATLTMTLISNSFEALEFTGTFGLFSNKHSYSFYVDVAMESQLKMFLPVVILGVLGGLAGVGFTWLNLKICKWRNRWIARIPWRRVVEVVVVAFVTTTLCILVPLAFKCVPVDCAANPEQGGCTPRMAMSGFEAVEALQQYTCPVGYFNPGATLLFAAPEKTIEHLLSRGTHYQLDYGPVITLLLLYLLLACYTAGMAQSSGIMVPSLLIGAALGRLFGLIVTDIAGGPHPGTDDRDWQDPGVFALIGAAAFFSGVTRLTISLIVIFIEMTNETHFLLPVMTAVVAARLTADACMDSLYHNLMQLKYLPYLPDELHTKECLELHSAKDVMSTPAVTVTLFGPVLEVARVMLASTHSAFPVVEQGQQGEVFKGVILRNHVYSILAREELFVDPPAGVTFTSSASLSLSRSAAPPGSGGGSGSSSSSRNTKAPFNREYSLKMNEANRKKYGGVLGPDLMSNLDDHLPPRSTSPTPSSLPPSSDADTSNREALILRLMSSPESHNKWVNLSPYVDMSSYSVPETFSLERGYTLFRTMGLRHLTVVDKFNNVVGMLSRKDLLSLQVNEKLAAKKEGVRRRNLGGGGGGGVAMVVVGGGEALRAEDRGPSVETLDRSASRDGGEEEEGGDVDANSTSRGGGKKEQESGPAVRK